MEGQQQQRIRDRVAGTSATNFDFTMATAGNVGGGADVSGHWNPYVPQNENAGAIEVTEDIPSSSSGIEQSRYSNNPGAGGALPMGVSAAEPRVELASSSTGRSQPIVTRASTSASASAVLPYLPLEQQEADSSASDDDDEPIELPFVCQAENCGRSFSFKKSMILHQRYAHWLHKGCRICKDSGKGFRDWGLDSQTEINSHFEHIHPEMVSTKHYYIFSVFMKTGQIIDENIATYTPNQTFTTAAAVGDEVSGEINSLQTELNTQIDVNLDLQRENVTIRVELQQSQIENVKIGEELTNTKASLAKMTEERDKLQNGVKQVTLQLQKMMPAPDGSVGGGANSDVRPMMPPPPPPPVISRRSDVNYERRIAELENDKMMLQDRCREKDRIIARLRRERDARGDNQQQRHHQPYSLQRRQNNHRQSRWDQRYSNSRERNGM